MVDCELSVFDILIFGASGDLALRKLFPALFQLHQDGKLHQQGRIIGLSRSPFSRGVFSQRVKEAMIKYGVKVDDESWKSFSERLDYISVDAGKVNSYEPLKQTLEESSGRVRVVYLATISALYGPICKALDEQGLITPQTRVVLEKPIGRDLKSAKLVDEEVGKHFSEEQIYRIDHYIGKETVQNLLVLRFANSIFESQWNHHWIDHIQITISETLGVEKRAGFYDHVGALRDMLQNHLLQLLCFTAMEPPAKLDADAVRDEKIKVIRALRPIEGVDVEHNVVRGQYRSGAVNGEVVPPYRDEPGVEDNSCTETFVSMKVEIENWRWSGVPFYLRTGKRLAERSCEIVVQFRSVPHSIFHTQQKLRANRLVFRLQPDDGVQLRVSEKKAGAGVNLKPTTLSLSDTESNIRVPDAYERLMGDVIDGNQTLFVRHDELLAAWEWVDPILNRWEADDEAPEAYAAGTWGPSASTLLMAKDGRLWNENE